MNDTNKKKEKHSVKSGESLSRIAKLHGVTLKALRAANPDIKDPSRIQVNQIILIPAQSAAGVGPSQPGEDQPLLPPSASQEDNAVSTTAGTGPNSILFEAESKGASNKTANQDGLPARGIRGVQASEAMADTDRKRVMKHKTKFEEAARKFKLPPALLAAIASRESRGGSVLKNGFGDGGHGFGLMQVDDRNPFPVAKEGGPAGQPHINQATNILKDKLTAVRQKFPQLSKVEQLQTAVSRYNGGKGLPSPESDRGTTGGDYMNDVWARARFYAQVEPWDTSDSESA